MGTRLQGNSSQRPGLLLGSSNLVVPPIPLIPLALEGVLEQQIEVILICPWWTGAMCWPQLVELRTDLALIRMPAAADCLRFSKGSMEELPNLDPLYAFHIRGKVV